MTGLGDRWTFPIIDALIAGPVRFADLRRRLRINANVLARGLRLLVHERLVQRLTWPTGAPHVEYDLTADGRELHRCLLALEQWHIRHADLTRGTLVSALDVQPRAPRAAIAQRSTTVCAPSEDQGPRWTDFPPAPLMHVSLSVRDITRSAQVLARLLRTDVPAFVRGTVEQEHTAGTVALCTFPLPNFFVELVQHESGDTPYGKFTRAHGDGIHHVAFHVERDRFAQRVDCLERRAGTCIIGGPATSYAAFDCRATLGTTIELLFGSVAGECWARECTAAVNPTRSLLAGAARVSHIGIVVEDVHRAAEAYAELFDLEPPRVRIGSPRFPRDVRAAANAHMKIAIVRRPNVSIQLIEPVGASPMRDYLEEHGNAVHHIGLSAGEHLDRSVRALEAFGARRVLGRRGDAYAHMDLRAELGMLIELTGHPSARLWPAAAGTAQ